MESESSLAMNQMHPNEDEYELMKRASEYKKELDEMSAFEHERIIKRTNEINEIMLHKKNLIELKKEIEAKCVTAKHDQERRDLLEKHLKQEEISNEQNTMKIKKLEESNDILRKNSEFRNQANLKKIKDLENKLDKEKSQQYLKIQKEVQDSETRLKLKHEKSIKTLESQNGHLEKRNVELKTKFDALDHHYNVMKQDCHILKKKLSEKNAQYSSEIEQKDNCIKTLKTDLQITQTKFDEKSSELNVILESHKKEIATLVEENDKKLKQIQIENEDLKTKLEIELARACEEKHILKEEHTTSIHDIETIKKEMETSLFYYENENSFLKFKLTMLNDFVHRGVSSFKRNFDEIKNDSNILHLENFKIFKKLKEESTISKTEKAENY
jgi:hypothetical protein